MENITTNNINPDHYKKECSLECIEAMEIVFGEKAVLDFCICNAWKYIWRWRNKNGEEDLAKAEWYINRAFRNSSSISRETYDILKRMHDYVTSALNTDGDGEYYAKESEE